MSQNYPNPFNPETTIGFSLHERSHVTLEVYNVAGYLVRTLLDEFRDAGTHNDVRWDGRSDKGTPMPSGVYLYRLMTKGSSQTRKMILLQ